MNYGSPPKKEGNFRCSCQAGVTRIRSLLSRTVNRNLDPPYPLAEPADRPQDGPNTAFYTPFVFLHLNILRKSLPSKHLQCALAIRPPQMQGISRSQWEPAAKHAGSSPSPRRLWEPQPKDAGLCIIMQDFAAANIDEGCRNPFAACHVASIMHAPSLRPIVTTSLAPAKRPTQKDRR